MIEQIINRSIRAKVAAVLCERMTHFGDRAVSIVGQAIHHHRGTTGTVALVANFLVIRTVSFACTAFYRTLDVIFRHALRLRLIDGQPQSRIRIDIAAAHFRRDGNLTNQLGKKFAALFILGTLAVLDIRPFTVSCHYVLLLPSPSQSPTGMPGGNCAYDSGY